MRIAIFGTGGVGGYFGGRLAQAGEEVTFIARGDHLRAMQTNGLRVESPQGDFLIQPAQASDDPRQVGEVDAVLVGVKSWQVPEAAQAMQPMIGAHTFAVPLENGVDAPKQLGDILGMKHVIGGMCQISAFVASPGYIRHVGLNPYIAFGEMDGNTSERVERLMGAFSHTIGVTAEVSPNIRSAMWRKFLFIAAISGVGAAARAPVGVIRSLPGTRQMLEQCMQEVLAVAYAYQVMLPDSVIEETMAFIDNLGPSVTASMQRDIMDGRPSELEAQNGAVVRMGLERGVQTPVNTYLYSSLLPQEKKARGEIKF